MQHSHHLAIADLVSKLLSHYATADEPLSVRRGIAEDWIEDLAEFTQPQVEWACREWRRTQTMRPAIADIRRLATHAQTNEREKRSISFRRELDSETVRMWERPEYEGDQRSWQQRRNDAIERQEQRYRRAH